MVLDNNLQLISPHEQYEEAYYKMLKEWRLSGEELVPFVLEFTADNFKDLIKKIKDCSIGIGIPEGFVPHSTYWLADDRNKIIGVSNLRHRLTEKIEIKRWTYWLWNKTFRKRKGVFNKNIGIDIA